MHVRLINEADAVQVIDIMYEVVKGSQYARGHAPINPDRLGDMIVHSLRNPEQAPCMVVEADDGHLTGLLYGHVHNMLYGDERWFFERVFYVRPDDRSYPLLRAYMHGLEEWCKQEGICRIELGNGYAPNPRLSLLYRRMGFEIVNTTYARRV